MNPLYRATSLILLSLTLSCASEVGTSSRKNSDRASSCINLNVLDGFENSAELELALSCLHANERYPELARFLEQFHVGKEREALVPIANEVIRDENLAAIINVLEIWQARVGPSSLHSFVENLSDVVHKADLTFILKPVAPLLLEPKEFDPFLLTLVDQGDSERLRDQIHAILSDSDAPRFFSDLAAALRSPAEDHSMPFFEALRSTGTLAQQGRLAAFDSAWAALQATSTYRQTVGKTSKTLLVFGQLLAGLYLVDEAESAPITRLTAAVASLDKPLVCGAENVVVADNGAVEMFERVFRPEARPLPDEILNRWKPEACGLKREEIAFLLKVQKFLAATPDSIPSRWIREFVQSKEATPLVHFLASLSRSSIFPTWERWIRITLHDGSLVRLIDSISSLDIQEPSFAVSSHIMAWWGRPEMTKILDRWTTWIKENPTLLQVTVEGWSEFFAPESFRITRELVGTVMETKTSALLFHLGQTILESPLASLDRKIDWNAEGLIQGVEFLGALERAKRHK